MYRTVLLPLDGSHFGEHALQLATSLARRSGAKLELVHVHNPNSDVVAWEPVTAYRFQNLEIAEREWDGIEVQTEENYLFAHARVVSAELTNATSCRVINGPVVPALETEIRDVDPDLVVMATHGRSGFSRAWLGSVADALVRNVHKPILLVRAKEDEADPAPTRISNIVIPLDGSLLAESIIPHALELAEGVVTTFTLLRVVPPVWTAPEMMSEPDTISEGALKDRIGTAREYLATVAEMMKGEGVEVKCDVVVGTAAAATILEYARNREADIVAMATHGRGGVKRLLLGSVADKVIRGAHLPVLLFHPA